jgi:hypothetical protein
MERFCVVVKNFVSGVGSETISNSVEGKHDSKEQEDALRKHWEVERLRRALDVVSVPCSVRQGSRMSRMSLSPVPSFDYSLYFPHRTTVIDTSIRVSHSPC